MKGILGQMTIGKKLILSILIVNIVSVSLLLYFIFMRASNLQTEAAFENARNLAGKYAKDVQARLEVPMDAARTIAQVMQAFDKLEPAERRNDYNQMLRSVLEANPEFIGVWTLWEPNALDGLDKKYANTEGTDSTGRFIPYWNRGGGKIGVEPLVDYTVSGAGDYYLEPVRTGDESIIDPYFYEIGGESILITSLVVPIKKNGRVVGVAGIDIAISEIQALVEQIKPYETGVAAIFSNGGIVTSHFDSSKLGKEIRISEREMVGEYIDEFVDSVKNGKPMEFSVYSAPLRTDVQIITVPFSVGLSKTPWAFAVGIPMDKVLAPVSKILQFTIIFGFVVLVVLVIAVIVIARNISHPIREASNIAGLLAVGDFTVQVPKNYVQRSDEIGALSQSFMAMIEKISAVVGTVNRVVANVADGNEQLSNGVQDLSSGSSEQAASVEETSATLEQSSASIEQNLENARKTDGIASKSAEQALEGADSVRKTETAMRTITEKITIIEDIAYQTNLLALNAAIEAARAGEHGRGFAVVASEVRKLAARSESAAGEISSLAKDSVLVAESARAQIDEIIPQIKLTAELVQEIAASSQEQSSGIGQITQAILQLEKVTQNNAALSEELAATAEQINDQTGQLTREVAFFQIGGQSQSPVDSATKLNRPKPTVQSKPKSVPPEQVSKPVATSLSNSIDDDEDDYNDFERY